MQYVGEQKVHVETKNSGRWTAFVLRGRMKARRLIRHKLQCISHERNNMDNNDILVRIRYALDLKNKDMLKIFDLGGMTVTRDNLIKMMIRTRDLGVEEEAITPDHKRLADKELESFLNGLITFKRGPQPAPRDGKARPLFIIVSHDDVNNVLLKKLKIALALKQEDMVAIFEKSGLRVSGSEITALLRKKGHKHYRPCLDNFARNFLLGMARTYRKN